MQLKRLFAFEKEGMAKSVVIVLVYNIVEKLIMTGRGIVFARVMGPSEYGVFCLAYFFIPVALAIARMGIPTCFTRYVSQYEMKNALRDFIKKTFGLLAAGGIVVGLFTLLFSHRLSLWVYSSPLYPGIILLCGLTVLPNALFEGLDAIFAGLRIFKLQSLMRFTQFIIFTALGIILVLLYRKTTPLIIANLFSLVTATAFFGWLLVRYLKQHRSPQIIQEPDFYRKIFSFSLAYFFAPVIYLLFSYTDRWMLVQLTDLYNVGIYSAATRFSGLIVSFGVLASNVLVPNLSQLWEAGEKEKAVYMLNFSTKVSTLLLFGISVGLYLVKDQIVPLFYGNKYIDSLPIIGVILIFGLFQSINLTIGGFARLIEKTYILPLCHAIGLVVNLILNYILISRFGIMGAAAASTISSALILAFMLAWFHREGLKVTFSTVLACALPLLLIFNKWIAAGLCILVAGIILKTPFFLKADEREVLVSQFHKARLKFAGHVEKQ